ncbi:MAG: hypothetical protein ACRDT0_04815 [Pseudonocardiaceae bacterium]
MSTPNDDMAVVGLATPVGWVSVAVTRVGLAEISWAQRDELIARAALQTLCATVGRGESATYGELGHTQRDRCHGPAHRGDHEVQSDPDRGSHPPGHRPRRSRRLQRGSGRDSLQVKRWLLTLEGVLPPTLGWAPGHLAA